MTQVKGRALVWAFSNEKPPCLGDSIQEIIGLLHFSHLKRNTYTVSSTMPLLIPAFSPFAAGESNGLISDAKNLGTREGLGRVDFPGSQEMPVRVWMFQRW